MILPSAMAIGWGIGYLIDRLLGRCPVASIILTLVGAGAGFYEIVHILIPDRNSDAESPKQS